MRTENINIEYVKIEDLIFAEYNPRKASEKEFADLKDNIEKFGFVDPIVVNINPDRKNIIIGGHFRVKVAKSLGIDKVPVIYINLPNIELEKELNVRLNLNTGSFDYEILANEFEVEDLTAWGFTLGDLGMEETKNTNKEIDSGSLGSESIITLKYPNDKYLEILELMKQAKDGLGFITNEELIENLLKDNVQL